MYRGACINEYSVILRIGVEDRNADFGFRVEVFGLGCSIQFLSPATIL